MVPWWRAGGGGCQATRTEVADRGSEDTDTGGPPGASPSVVTSRGWQGKRRVYYYRRQSIS